jgi:methyltransferase (TIGR00027 family)
MRDNEASRTAQYMALFRALESVQPDGQRLFADAFAREFLGPGLRRVVDFASVPLFGRTIPWIIDRRWPGARTSGVARTRHIDEQLSRALNDGARQVVILGAGFDCRAYRIPGIERARVFEVDHPATQQAKRLCLERALGAMPEHVELVGIDFNRESLDQRLTAAGLSHARPTMWIWEGVTNYLTAEAVDGTMRTVRRMADRSRLVFTYVHRDVLADSTTFPAGRALRATLAKAGEEWTFGFDPAELPAYLAERGFRLIEDLGSVEYRQKWLPARPRLLRGYEFYRLAVAESVA